MTREERLRIARKFLDEHCLPTMEAKGRDYDDGKDANSNFMECALPSRGTDKYDMLWAHLWKQFSAVRTWFDTRQLQSESLESRIKDVINYCLILVSMLVEDGVVDLDVIRPWTPHCYGSWIDCTSSMECPVKAMCGAKRLNESTTDTKKKEE